MGRFEGIHSRHGIPCADWPYLGDTAMKILKGRRGQAAQGLAEYALILGLIAIAAVLALLFVGGAITKLLSTVGHAL